MRTNPPAHASIHAAIVALALLAGAASAQSEEPIAGAAASGTEAVGAQADQTGTAGEPATEPAAGEAAEAAAPETPGLSVIARWVRASACRVFIRLPIDDRTRFSPASSDRSLRDWRISIPRYAGAHVSLPERAPSPDGEVSAEVATIAAPDGAPTADASPAPAPPLTWTQRAGLVKAPAAVSGDAPAAPPMTWTQKAGLVKAPAAASAASGPATGVSSFKKAAKTDTKKD